MRYLISLLAGALLGALVAVTLAGILGQRNAWPRAVMTVMQHDLGRARDFVHDNRCDTSEMTSVTAELDLMASNIEPALLPPGTHDRVFSQYASDLRKAIASFGKAAGDCAARREGLTQIANACDACHRDYK
jgi:hypothetical protein